MKTFARFLFILVTFLAASAQAGQAYTQATFEQLTQQGKPVLVEVHADWCSTCKAQANITDALLREAPYRGITTLRVDYDKQKDVLKKLRVNKQSTLIVFRNGKEVGRSLGDTSEEGIENLLKKAI